MWTNFYQLRSDHCQTFDKMVCTSFTRTITKTISSFPSQLARTGRPDGQQGGELLQVCLARGKSPAGGRLLWSELLNILKIIFFSRFWVSSLVRESGGACTKVPSIEDRSKAKGSLLTWRYATGRFSSNRQVEKVNSAES